MTATGVRRPLALLLLALLLPGPGGATAGALASPAPRAAVLAAEDARFAALTARDLAALGATLADDLHYVHSNGLVEDRAALLDSVGSGRLRYHAIETVEREVLPLAPRAALVRGVLRLTVSAGSDAPRMLRIRYVALYRRERGDWRLRLWQSLAVGAN